MITRQQTGHVPEKPMILGEPDGSDPIQVYATGLYEGVRKGLFRWVTGDKVQRGIRMGALVPVADGFLDAEEASEAEHDQEGLEPAVAADPAPTTDPSVPSGDGDPLAALSKPALMKLAKAVALPGRSAMDKGELYDHLSKIPEVLNHLDG